MLWCVCSASPPVRNVRDDLGSGQPVAAIGHGSQAHGQATGPGFQLVCCSALLVAGLLRVDRCKRLFSCFGLLFLLQLQSVDTTCHRLKERCQRRHHLALVLRDVEIHLVCLAEGCREHVQHLLVHLGEVDAVKPLQTRWCWWTARTPLKENCVWLGFLKEPLASHWWRIKLRSIILTIVHWSRSKLRSVVRTIGRSERFWGRTMQKLEVDIASISDLADVI